MNPTAELIAAVNFLRARGYGVEPKQLIGMVSSPDHSFVYNGKVIPDVAFEYLIKGPNEEAWREVSAQQLMEEAARLAELAAPDPG